MNIPGRLDVCAALENLPADQVFAIAEHAVRLVLAGFISGDAYAPEDRPVRDPEARELAHKEDCELLTDLYPLVEGMLPDLFGPEGELPAWALEGRR